MRSEGYPIFSDSRQLQINHHHIRIEQMQRSKCLLATDPCPAQIKIRLFGDELLQQDTHHTVILDDSNAKRGYFLMRVGCGRVWFHQGVKMRSILQVQQLLGFLKLFVECLYQIPTPY
jgi:hypothetical protein